MPRMSSYETLGFGFKKTKFKEKINWKKKEKQWKIKNKKGMTWNKS